MHLPRKECRAAGPPHCTTAISDELLDSTVASLNVGRKAGTQYAGLKFCALACRYIDAVLSTIYFVLGRLLLGVSVPSQSPLRSCLTA